MGRRKRLGRRRRTGHANHALLFGRADDGDVGVGHHDQTAAGLAHLGHHVDAQHRAGAEQRVGRQAGSELGNRGERVGRVHRHFDQPKAFGVQGQRDGLDLVRCDAAQDGDKGECLKSTVHHVSNPIAVAIVHKPVGAVLLRVSGALTPKRRKAVA